MTSLAQIQPDSKLDLVLERFIDVPPELVWTAWTEPEHVREWLAPEPWTIVDCEIDLRPGGMFRFVMRSPEGQDFPNVACYLEVVPGKRLVWTDALLPGYRPSEKPFFTAIVSMKPEKTGTRYIAMAIHRDEAGRKQHEEMGFHEGWGQVLEQLVAYARKI
jgi:uncharacterized protein YndB with AHSA1/START domain